MKEQLSAICEKSQNIAGDIARLFFENKMTFCDETGFLFSNYERIKGAFTMVFGVNIGYCSTLKPTGPCGENVAQPYGRIRLEIPEAVQKQLLFPPQNSPGAGALLQQFNLMKVSSHAGALEGDRDLSQLRISPFKSTSPIIVAG